MLDFEMLIDRSPVLYISLETDGTIRYQNGAIERFCGYDRQELLGTSFLEHVHPDDRSEIERTVRNPTEATVTEPIGYRFQHADGSWIQLEISDVLSEPESDGHVVVSQKRSDQTAVEQERDRYEVILGSLDDSVYAIDSDLNLAYISKAFAARKGVEREVLLGTDIRQWGTTEANERIIAAREELETPDDVGVVEYESRSADGEQITVENRFTTVARSDLTSNESASYAISVTGRLASKS